MEKVFNRYAKKNSGTIKVEKVPVMMKHLRSDWNLTNEELNDQIELVDTEGMYTDK